MARIRVMAYSAEGGGYLGKWCPAAYHDCPSWPGGWNGKAFETLFMAEGETGSAIWYLYFNVEPPMFEDFGYGNIVDRASYVLRLTDDLARRWFEGKSLQLPERLLSGPAGQERERLERAAAENYAVVNHSPACATDDSVGSLADSRPKRRRRSTEGVEMRVAAVLGLLRKRGGTVAEHARDVGIKPEQVYRHHLYKAYKQSFAGSPIRGHFDRLRDGTSAIDGVTRPDS